MVASSHEWQRRGAASKARASSAHAASISGGGGTGAALKRGAGGSAPAPRRNAAPMPPTTGTGADDSLGRPCRRRSDAARPFSLLAAAADLRLAAGQRRCRW